MKLFFKLAILSLANRKFSTFLTIFSISLSVALLLSVEKIKQASEDGFTQAVSQVDLLVGSRTGPINLILYSVFNMGSATNNISWESYQNIKSDPKISWTIPYSLGDGHRGFRVVATDENFYQHYRFRGQEKPQILIGGKPALGIWDVVVGSEVQKKLNYKLGDKVVLAHGVTRTEGLVLHEDKPFTVTGVFEPTGTAIDQSLYISLYGMEAIHIDWKNGAMPKVDDIITQDKIHIEMLQPKVITSFFLRSNSRIDTLGLQRMINTYKEEPLLAVIPGVVLSELWRGLSQIEIVLKVISWLVLIIGVVSMCSSIISSLNERRREMSILRSLGASPSKILNLFLFESLFLTVSGVFAGILFQFLIFFFSKELLQQQFGFYLQSQILSINMLTYCLIVIICGLLAGLIPAIIARQKTLKDGLSVKT
jgi:putative ABC transport system permease protein